MESILPLVTRIRNDTSHFINFSLEEGTCPIPRLKPGGRRPVNLSKIFYICRHRGSVDWQIEVLIDEKFTGLILQAEDFFRYVLITFKYRAIENDEFIVIAEAVSEKPIDILFRLGWNIGSLLGRNMRWNRRSSLVIAEALPQYSVNTPLRERGDPKSPHRAPKDSIKKRLRNMCHDVDVVPEAIESLDMMKLRTRKEESLQPDSRKKVEVKPSGREEKGQLDKYADVFVQSRKVASPERTTTICNPAFAGSQHETFRTSMLKNSSLTEPVEREGNDSEYPHLQHLMHSMEYDHQSHSLNAPNMDIYNHIFLFIFSLLLVGFIRMLLLGFKFTLL